MLIEHASRACQALAWRYRQHQDRAFDKRYGLDTGQGDASRLPPVGSQNAKFAVPYEPVQLFMFHRMLSSLAIRHRDYVFLDLGSGKGRALLLAAPYGFSEIVGVEFSPELHAIAAANVDAFTKKAGADHRIRLLCRDATEHEFPRKNLVLFLYNPFFGAVMQTLVDRIGRFIATEPCDFWLLYRNPQCADLFDATPGLRLHSSTGSFRIYRKTSGLR
jgi:SAM-dependent methyltransferase